MGLIWRLVASRRRSIGCRPIQLAVMKNSGYEFVEVKQFVSLDE